MGLVYDDTTIVPNIFTKSCKNSSTSNYEIMVDGRYNSYGLIQNNIDVGNITNGLFYIIISLEHHNSTMSGAIDTVTFSFNVSHNRDNLLDIGTIKLPRQSNDTYIVNFSSCFAYTTDRYMDISMMSNSATGYSFICNYLNMILIGPF